MNLKGKKTAAKVLAPNINKDNALYFGGQNNKIELVYHNTAQVRSVKAEMRSSVLTSLPFSEVHPWRRYLRSPQCRHTGEEDSKGKVPGKEGGARCE